MFNDERINKEISNLKKYLIILSVIVACIFLGIKIYYSTINELSIVYYITELVIILAGTGTLIGSLFIRAEIKDEMFYERIHKYFDKAFKIFVCLTFISFACVMGGTLLYENQDFSSAVTINLILTISLFVGYAYLRYKNIYFNYNLIEEDNKTYYKGVFKNILKIFLFFLIIYSIGIAASLLFTNKSQGLTQSDFSIVLKSIISAFFTSSIGVGLYYLFISIFEKSFVNEEENKKITIPTIILVVLAIVFNALYLIISIKESMLINQMQMDPSSAGNFSAMLTKLSNNSKFFREWGIHLQTLGLVFLAYDATKGDKALKNKAIAPLLIFIFYSFISLIVMKLDPMLLDCVKNLSQNEISQFVNIKAIVLACINTGIIIALLITCFVKLKEQMIKHKGILILLIANFLITIVEFSLSFNDNAIIRGYIELAWMGTLLVVFVAYLIMLHIKRAEEEEILS